MAVERRCGTKRLSVMLALWGLFMMIKSSYGLKLGDMHAIIALKKGHLSDEYEERVKGMQYVCAASASHHKIHRKMPYLNNHPLFPISNLTGDPNSLCFKNHTKPRVIESREIVIVSRTQEQLKSWECSINGTAEEAAKLQVEAIIFHLEGNFTNRKELDELLEVGKLVFDESKPILLKSNIRRWPLKISSPLQPQATSSTNTSESSPEDPSISTEEGEDVSTSEDQIVGEVWGKKDEKKEAEKFGAEDEEDEDEDQKPLYGGIYQSIPPPIIKSLVMISVMAMFAFFVGAFWGGRNMARDYGAYPLLVGEYDDDEIDYEQMEMEEEPTGGQYVMAGCCGVGVVTALLLLLYQYPSVLSWILLVAIWLVSGIAAGLVIFGTIAYYTLSSSTLEKMVHLHSSQWLPFPEKVNHYKLISVILGLILSTIWIIFRKNDAVGWWFQDILGICLCIMVISGVVLPNLVYCTALLCGLVCYDVFMVYLTPFIFGTEESVMVTVAKGDNAVGYYTLGMLKIPKFFPMHDYDTVCEKSPWTIIGFGDIIVPGILAAYCYGFDIIYRTPNRNLYFLGQIVAYVIGLFAAFSILVLTSQPVPALLTLVPCHLAAVYILYWLRIEDRYPLMWGPTREYIAKGAEISSYKSQRLEDSRDQAAQEPPVQQPPAQEPQEPPAQQPSAGESRPANEAEKIA